MGNIVDYVGDLLLTEIHHIAKLMFISLLYNRRFRIRSFLTSVILFCGNFLGGKPDGGGKKKAGSLLRENILTDNVSRIKA